MSVQIDYRKPHVFDPIHDGSDECECGLTFDADIHMRETVSNDTQVRQEAPERIYLHNPWNVERSRCGCDRDIAYVPESLLATVRREVQISTLRHAIELADELEYELPQFQHMQGAEAVRNKLQAELAALEASASKRER